MHIFTPALNAALSAELATLSTCWKITRRDGVVLGLCDHHEDLVCGGITYHAQGGMTPTALAQHAHLTPADMEIEGILESDLIKAEDIMAGAYDHASVACFVVDHTAPDAGTWQHKSGIIGRITLHDGRFTAELQGITQRLGQHIGELFSPQCRAQLGDARCGVDMSTRSASGTISAVTSRAVFQDSSRTETAEFFRFGNLTFTSGANNGHMREVRMYQASGIFTLLLPLPYDLSIGDSYSVTQGCDRRFATCCERFSNALNFRGEPHIPGLDKLMQTAGTRSEW